MNPACMELSVSISAHGRGTNLHKIKSKVCRLLKDDERYGEK